jgi:tetratricopeptide (TPR) repeat protein
MSSSHLSLPNMFDRYFESIWHYYCAKAQYGKLRELMTTILWCLKDMEHDAPTYIPKQLRIAAVLMLLGDISKESGRVDEAIAEYTEAIKVLLSVYNLFVARLMHKRGMAYFHHNHYSEAVVDLQSAFERFDERMDDGEVADIAKNLGIVLYRSIETSAYKMSSSHLSLPNMFDRYFEDIWHYYCAFPQYGKLHELMTTILWCLKDMEHDAPTYIPIQLRIATVLMLLGDISKESGRVDEAIAEYTEAIKVLPPVYNLFVARLMHKRGMAYLHHNHYSEAVVDLQSAIKWFGEIMDGEVADITKNLGIALNMLDCT